MGRNLADFSTHRPADGSIPFRRRRARGWGGRLGYGTAVGGGRRQLWLVKWGSTWPKHKTSQRFQNTRKINATTYQMTRLDESFEGRCVVKQEDRQLWSYGEGDDAAMENPIAAWFLEQRWEVDLQTDCARFFVGRLLI